MTAKGPTTFLEFQRAFPDEAACEAFLFEVRWPDGFVCPVCGDRRARKHRPRGLIQCGNGHQISLTTGTAMHRTKQPICLWFWAAYLVSTLTPGISALQLQRQLGVKRYETAFNLLHKLRSALVAPGREPLRGEVEIDEAFIGGPEEGKPGRGAEKKVLVIVAVEVIRWHEERIVKGKKKRVEFKRAGRTRMSVIPNAEGSTLVPWVKAHVEKGATVYTDGWSGYAGLTAAGYVHQRVLQTYKGEKTGLYLPMVHVMISNLKRWLLGTHKGAVRAQHLQAYLNEFTFRFNRRLWRGPAFLRALGLVVHAENWPEYETLYATKKPEGGWEHPSANRMPRLDLNDLIAHALLGTLQAGNGR